MKRLSFRAVLLLFVFLVGCSVFENRSGSVIEMAKPTPSPVDVVSDLDLAQQTLVSFFDALAQEDFRLASDYHIVPNPLIFLYPDIDQEHGEALLKRACIAEEEFGCHFYCWRIKRVVSRSWASPGEFHFTVQFEDEDGNLLIGGENVTPRVCDPPGCKHTEYSYVVRIRDGRFYVDGIPVFSGCWP